ncbi:POWERDRESS [Hibiscus trionum]|uniref:POWERDRESS n=1 Tax=Hibiscus trionum TaxID=183268 RepID=A0A9W7HMM2_HIBTR|nr:POWERDRESS [Hibiscus trionum]
MPPEPLPWDRKDFYRERTQSLPQQPLTARWGDSSPMSPYQHGSFREFTPWGPSDFRRPPGHGRQGSWHLFAEENGGHGYVPSRSGNKILDDKNFSQSDPRVDGKYGRNSRENDRGSYSERDWRVHSWESCNGSPSTPGRPHHVNNERRSVDDMPSYHSQTHSVFVNTWDQLQKGQHDNKTCAVNGLGTGQKCQRESSVGSIDWKPLKWSHSGSLSSWGSGFSHSSSSKSLGGVDSGEGKHELQQKNLTPVQSPSGDAATCVTSAGPSDETASRKKPRLAWGEGLAKYEKKKVEGPDASTDKGGAMISVCNAEYNNSPSSNLADKSPRVLGFSDCASPATPSSVACSSSPGVEEKIFVKAANIDNDIGLLCASPSIGSQNQLEGASFNLEKLDINSIINMGSSLINLLQPDDPCMVDSSFVRSTAISKLLLLKGDALKALEMTESEIDSLENELKLLKGDSRSGCPCPATSSSLPVEEHGKACGEQVAVSVVIPRPPLEIDTCGDALVQNLPLSNGVLEEVNDDVKDGDIDSPGTATSKFVEPLSLEKAVSPSDIVKFHECSGDLGSVQLTTMEEVILAPGSGNEGIVTTISAEGSVLKKIDNDALVSESLGSDAGGENTMYEIILATNKILADVASDVFNRLLPKDLCGVEISEIANVACMQYQTAIREKIAMRKQYLRFKERVLTLKFKAFQNAWKEDMRSLSMRKCRAKSLKKYELSLRATHSGYQKHRSSIRSRVASPAGNLVLEPSAVMINFASRLLDSCGRIHRNALKMPALILDEKEKVVSRFISSNGLVEDPFAIEKERALINPWTSEEKEIFIHKLAAFGKDFRKIASFLDHKTTADCVEFYYKNHKSECFEKTKNRNDLSKPGKSAVDTYLLTSGKKRSRENAVSLDVLGAASVIAAHAKSSIQNWHKSTGMIVLGGRFDSKTSLVDDSIDIKSSNFDIVGSDQDTVAADVLAGICGSFSSEAMSSCITSSAGPGESCHLDRKCHKVDSVVKRPSTSDVLQNVDEDTCSDESCGEMGSAHWTDEEKSIFIQAVSSYGKDFEMISRYVGTRSSDQCKVFFSKARKCLGLDLMNPRTRNTGTPMSDDANGGGTDTEDACVQESSVICGDKLGSIVDDGLPRTIVCMNVEESNPTMEPSLQTDPIISEGNDGRLVDCKNSEAVEAIISDVDQTGTISEGGADDMEVDSNQAESLQVQNSVALANLNALRNHVVEQGVPLAVSASHRGTADPRLSSLDALVEPKSDAACFTEGFGSNRESQKTLLSKTCTDERDTKFSAETGSQIICRLGSNKTGDESIEKTFNTKGMHQVPLDMGSTGMPSIFLLPYESSANVSALHDSDNSQCENICNQDRLSSALAYPETEDIQAHKSVSGHESKRFSGKPLVDHAEVQISTLKEINVDVSRSQLPEVKRLSTLERGVTGSFLAQDYLHKCNGPKPAAELPQQVQKSELANSRQKSHTRSLSDTEKPCRNGNVKLFGQILNSSSQDVEKVSHFSKQSVKYSDFNSSGRKNVGGNGSFSKFDQNMIFAPKNVPKRSYGFWDGNRIQTGLSSLPDSAILVSKYPAAFVNYPSTSSQMEQQASQTVVRNTDRNLNGISVFIPGEISSNSTVMDYQGDMDIRR